MLLKYSTAQALPPISLKADGDLPTELYAVSEGDPSVVRLYVDALTAPGDLESHRRDLPTRPPGLDGYFERWWDEQRQLWGRDAPLREPAVRSPRNLLAGALGPLTPDDFLALDRTLDSWNLEEAMLPLRRLITGDRSAGYAYAHPRLADHFYSRLQQAGQRALEMEFVEWGRDALRNLVAMDGTAVLPAYLSQHWASHLRRAGLRKELFAVVRDDRWYRLQLAADPTEGAFIQDLETAWAEADTENPHSPSDGTSVNLLADALEYALAIASLRSRSSNLPPAALPYLIEERSWSVRQAFAAARQYPDPENRAEAFAVLGDTLTDARERVAAWRAAIGELGSVSEYQAVTLFRQWASKLPETVFPDALDAARGCFTDEQLVTALASLLTRLGSDRQQVVADEAAAAARSLPDTSVSSWSEEAPRARALIQLALSAPQPLCHDFTAEALTAARSIQSPRERAVQLARSRRRSIKQRVAAYWPTRWQLSTRSKTTIRDQAKPLRQSRRRPWTTRRMPTSLPRQRHSHASLGPLQSCRHSLLGCQTALHRRHS